MNTSPNDPADMHGPDDHTSGPPYPHKMTDKDAALIVDAAVWHDATTQPDPIGALVRRYGPNLTSLITWAHREGMPREHMVALASDIRLGDTDHITVTALVNWVIERADHHAANPSINVVMDETPDLLTTDQVAGQTTVHETWLRDVLAARPEGRWPVIWYEPKKLPAGKTSVLDWLAASPDEAASMLRDAQDAVRARQQLTGGDDSDDSRIMVLVDEFPDLSRTATDPNTTVTWTVDQYNDDPAELLAEAAKTVGIRQNLRPTTLDQATELVIVLRPQELADLDNNPDLRTVRQFGPAVKVTVRSPVLRIQPQEQANHKLPKPYYINPDGTVRRQDRWRGDPAQLVGFQYDLDENQVDLDLATWQAGDIEDAIGTYPVFLHADGSMYTLEWPIESVREHPELGPEA